MKIYLSAEYVFISAFGFRSAITEANSARQCKDMNSSPKIRRYFSLIERIPNFKSYTGRRCAKGFKFPANSSSNNANIIEFTITPLPGQCIRTSILPCLRVSDFQEVSGSYIHPLWFCKYSLNSNWSRSFQAVHYKTHPRLPMQSL